MFDVAVLFPSSVVTVIIAVPTPTPVTTPLASTIATVISSELQVTSLSVAFAGKIISFNIVVFPSVIIIDNGSTLTLVTGIGGVFTVIKELAKKLPSSVVIVIIADPTPTPVTRPVAFTVAKDVLLEDQVTF